MSLIVQKFGGTSVADTEKILAAARKAIRAQQEGHRVVMVVSAMGKNTDMLVELAEEISERPPAREMDMLLSTGEQVSVALMAMAIDTLGAKGVSLTGAQIGIRTDATHTKARIRSISTERVDELLEAGNIVIAAGFQGIDEDLNITTLGRGGSDTTAVALAAVLDASECQIYTDVDGVYTTDPRLLPAARQVQRISYDEMLELASLGAGVMHSRSIEFAKKFGVPIHVRNSFSDVPGTIISDVAEDPDAAVSGATLTKDEARVTIFNLPDVPGTLYEVVSHIAAHNVTVDMIVQNVGSGGVADVSFTVPSDELQMTLEAIEESRAKLGDIRVLSNDHVSKISAVGLGMAHQAGIAGRMFETLAAAEINMEMITTSEIKISALVNRDDGFHALQAVHSAFNLHLPPRQALPNAVRPPAIPDRDPQDVVRRLRGFHMEGLYLDGIELDDTQARVTVAELPDQPGVAAKIFGALGQHNVFVDMIVQSFSPEGVAFLSFTVPSDGLTQAEEVTREIANQLSCGPISTSPRIAKLSVSGIGLRSHTGVAIRVFRALAESHINVSMINTSEVRVNVVVEPECGTEALACLQQAFADVL